MTLRWYGPAPLPGHYLMTPRGRGGYLVLGVRDRGRRGGCGRPVYNALVIEAERVPRAEAEKGVVHEFWWDPRRAAKRVFPAG